MTTQTLDATAREAVTSACAGVTDRITISCWSLRTAGGAPEGAAEAAGAVSVVAGAATVSSGLTASVEVAVAGTASVVVGTTGSSAATTAVGVGLVLTRSTTASVGWVAAVVS